MKHPPLELPYVYDNRLKGRIYAVLCTTVLLAGFIFLSGMDLDRFGPILFCFLFSFIMGLLVYRQQAGAWCEVTATTVTLKPDNFLFIPSSSAKGSFLASDFSAVKLVPVAYEMGRVVLIPQGTSRPHVLLQPLRPSQARYLAELIAQSMKLPLEGVDHVYWHIAGEPSRK